MDFVTKVNTDVIDFRTRIEVLPDENGKYKVELRDHEWGTHLVLAPYTDQEDVSVGRLETSDDILPSADYVVKKDIENNFLKYMLPLDAVNGEFYINGITGTCYVFVLVNQNIVATPA